MTDATEARVAGTNVLVLSSRPYFPVEDVEILAGSVPGRGLHLHVLTRSAPDPAQPDGVSVVALGRRGSAPSQRLTQPSTGPVQPENGVEPVTTAAVKTSPRIRLHPVMAGRDLRWVYRRPRRRLRSAWRNWASGTADSRRRALVSSGLRVAGKLVSVVVAQGRSRSFWSDVRGDPRTSRLLAEVHVVVALDPGAVRAAWHLARRRPDVPVLLGRAPAQATIDRLVALAGQDSAD